MKYLREYIRLKICDVLIEGRLEDAKEKYRKRLSPSTINGLANHDPTANKKYLDWMCRELAVVGEASGKITDIIATANEWERVGRNLPEKDIYKLSAQEAEDALKAYDTSQTGKRKQRYQNAQGATFVGETDTHIVYHITSHAGAQALGTGTKWCITMSSDQYWKMYTNGSNGDARFYFLIPKSASSVKYALLVERYPTEPPIFRFEAYNPPDQNLGDSDLPEIVSAKPIVRSHFAATGGPLKLASMEAVEKTIYRASEQGYDITFDALNLVEPSPNESPTRMYSVGIAINKNVHTLDDRKAMLDRAKTPEARRIIEFYLANTKKNELINLAGVDRLNSLLGNPDTLKALKAVELAEQMMRDNELIPGELIPFVTAVDNFPSQRTSELVLEYAVSSIPQLNWIAVAYLPVCKGVWKQCRTVTDSQEVKHCAEMLINARLGDLPDCISPVEGYFRDVIMNSRVALIHQKLPRYAMSIRAFAANVANVYFQTVNEIYTPEDALATVSDAMAHFRKNARTVEYFNYFVDIQQRYIAAWRAGHKYGLVLHLSAPERILCPLGEFCIECSNRIPATPTRFCK